MKITKPRNFRRNAVTGCFDQLPLATAEDGQSWFVFTVYWEGPGIENRTNGRLPLSYFLYFVYCFSADRPTLESMAQSKSFFDDVKKELECPVCQEQFSEINEPKIMKCLHTFCKTCLEAWLRQHREGQLSCPTVVKSPSVLTATLAASHPTFFTSRWWK